jgi:hypothetical protein
MKFFYHPKFAQDIVQFARQYAAISPKLKARFRSEVDEALARIKEHPSAAGHFVNTGSAVITDVRRRDLVAFPFFVLYGLHADSLVFGALIPKASDPLTWLARFSNPA